MILDEGQKLVEVMCRPDADGGALRMSVTGPFGVRCESIVVSMENGQMAAVPWALCKIYDGEVIMINLALAESVEIDTSDQSEDE